MREIEIDGKSLTVEDGSTVMDAAGQAGVYIPHFCYHKKLSIAANCRMCLVDVEKMPKAVPACATPVTNGMKVCTHSDKAVHAQKAVMEFLLINHPLDCPVCDQGGECQLQDLAVGYGQSASRYQEEKRVVVNKNLGPLISTDMTRCINCTRCVRFTQEIAGKMELGQAYRGEHAEIMSFVSQTVDSEISGNVIDLCPVGALTSKPFRYSARTWEMTRRKSVSPHDALGSNLIVQVRDDVVKRVLPLENEELNECWLSDKDRFSYEGLHSNDRLQTPMIKQDGTWKTVDWQTALQYAGKTLNQIKAEHGAESIAALASPHATVEELYLLQKLVRGLGSDNIDFRLRHSDFSADGKRAGVPWLGMAVRDIAALDRLLVIGSFMRKDAPLLTQRVRQAVKHSLEVSAVGAVADDWLLPVKHRLTVAPSQILGKLLAIAAALAESKNETLSPLLAAMNPVIDEASRQLAQHLAEGKNSAIWLGSLAVQSNLSVHWHLAAQEIARLSGGKLGFIGEAANSVGGYLAGAVPVTGMNARQMLEIPRQAYLLLNVEPDLDTANPSQALATLKAAGSVMALTTFKSPALMEVADVMFPVAPFTETSGTFVNCEGRAQSFVAVARSSGETRPGWKVLRVLGNVLGLSGFDYNHSPDVLIEALTGDIAARLGNAVTIDTLPPASDVSGLERVSDVPLYFADPLVRRAGALQKTRDARDPVAAVHPDVLQAAGVQSGDTVVLSQGQNQIRLPVLADETVAPGCIRVPAAHKLTTELGAMCGSISLERV